MAKYHNNSGMNSEIDIISQDLQQFPALWHFISWLLSIICFMFFLWLLEHFCVFPPLFPWNCLSSYLFPVPVEGDYLAVMGAQQKTWLLLMLWYREQFHFFPLGLDKLCQCAPPLTLNNPSVLPSLICWLRADYEWKEWGEGRGVRGSGIYSCAEGSSEDWPVIWLLLVC